MRQKLQEIEKKLRLHEVTVLRSLSDKTAGALRPIEILIIAGVALLSALSWLSSFRAVSLLISVAYPAYASFQAIESPDKRDDKQWLTFWVVFAFFSAADSLTNLFLVWIPFYALVKMLFFGYLWLPQLRGAEMLYDHLLLCKLRTFHLNSRAVKPFFVKTETHVHRTLDSVSSAVKETAKPPSSIAMGEVNPQIIDLAATGTEVNPQVTDLTTAAIGTEVNPQVTDLAANAAKKHQ
ncbi:MAG: hypothetical protein MHM6MM_005131 [Cercozoa sp. M6MM]